MSSSDMRSYLRQLESESQLRHVEAPLSIGPGNQDMQPLMRALCDIDSAGFDRKLIFDDLDRATDFRAQKTDKTVDKISVEMLRQIQRRKHLGKRSQNVR
mgnify:CR=1 FL=1